MVCIYYEILTLGQILTFPFSPCSPIFHMDLQIKFTHYVRCRNVCNKKFKKKILLNIYRKLFIPNLSLSVKYFNLFVHGACMRTRSTMYQIN